MSISLITNYLLILFNFLIKNKQITDQGQGQVTEGHYNQLPYSCHVTQLFCDARRAGSDRATLVRWCDLCVCPERSMMTNCPQRCTGDPLLGMKIITENSTHSGEQGGGRQRHVRFSPEHPPVWS